MAVPTYAERYPNLLIGVEAGIATLTLNRPEAMNAVNYDLHDELERVWGDVGRDEAVRAIVLTGAGRAFSAGGDLRLTASRAGTDEGLRYALEVVGRVMRLMNAMLDTPQPVIAAVNGDAIGLGATLAFFADVSVVAEDAKIGDTHVRVGLVAGDGGAVIWPLLIGPNRAKDMLMRGKVFDGIEAERLGLANYVAPRDEVVAQARQVAEEVARLPTWAVRWTKRSINRMIKQQMEMVLEPGVALEALSMLTRDHGECAQAILDKRRPELRGW